MLLTVAFGLRRLHEDLVGVATDILVSADADVIVKDEIAVKLAVSEADRADEIIPEATNPVVAPDGNLPEDNAAFLEIIVGVVGELLAVLQSFSQDSRAEAARQFFQYEATLSDGLTFTTGSIKVYKESVDAANELASTAYAIKYKGDEGMQDNTHTFEVALNDAKSLAGKDIIVTYSAVLNENAEVGDVANTNTSTVIFSNDPHHNYDGTNYPGFPAEKEGSYLKETPETETETFTTGIKITKVDENDQILTGAEFQITGTSVQTVLVTEEYFRVAESGETPEYYELNSGEFTKDAPTQEAMILTPGATAGYVRDSEGTLVVGGQKYREYVPETDGDADVYVHQLSNEADYKYTSKTHVKDTKLTPVETSSTVKAKAFVDENGVVEFVGLGAGTYTITETTDSRGL